MGRRTTREVEAEPGDEKLDLSVAQVAGSSLATVAAALLASKLGVYGTILGAGVVSVVATAGGPVIQHLFRRTGDQLRDSARPKARQGPAPLVEDRPAAPRGEFGEPTVHGTRMRGWKRTAVASGAAFALAIGGLGTYEAVAGTSVSSGGGTLFSGGTRTADRDRPAPPEHGPADGEKERRGGAGDPGTGASPSPSRPHGDRSPSPDPAPSRSAGPAPDPSPSTHAPTPSPTPPAPDPVPTPGSGGATPGVKPSAS
ncbi:hypothetical protein ADK53_25400 [Streptomyces sp. WM6373]|uniref:hypothetical protein n=1 Tax=Streptomyces TaxID=1883 RepID=UPI0006C62BD4|nr:hypothetical protein [Streptomyces sp. WM6373]KOU31461.1 hypothetical protein ADK53_25400 [Streptomyces sp. WM6373]